MIKIKTLQIKDFKPSPFDLMDVIAKEKAASGLIFGFIHGSVVYGKDGVLCGTYKEVRVFETGTNKLRHSEFLAVVQEPDVDIVVVVNNRRKFMKYFKKFEYKYDLNNKINYFLTINSISERTLKKEVASSEATAIKRILSMRPLWGFGNIDKLGVAQGLAKKYTKSYDRAFQKEYDDRKKTLRENLKLGVEKFILQADNYKKQYPLYFEQIWSDTAAGFPANRDKIVLPRPMDLKIRRDVDSIDERKLR